MTAFDDAVAARFPGAIGEDEFIRRTYDALTALGFDADNAISCVGVCRDELCRSLVWSARDTWGEAFNFSSLGGMLTLGTSGFVAAHCHAPIVGGRERYVYIVMPHIGIGAGGELGRCERQGRHGSSTACGALHGVLAELTAQKLDLRLNPDNIEYSLLKHRLAPRLLGVPIPDIAGLTVLAAELTTAELEHMIELTVDVDIADYAVLTGIQIHRPVEGTLVWPYMTYACVGGERRTLQL